MPKLLWIAAISALFAQSLSAEKLFSDHIANHLIDADKDGVIAIRDKCLNTPTGSKVDNAGCPVTKNVSQLTENKVELDVRFDTNKYELEDNELKGLLKLGKFLQKHRTSDVIIEGHTDSMGDDEDNLRLSQNRANAIKQALVTKFLISSDRIIAIGHGENQPIANNETEYGRAVNRRVTAEVTHINKNEFQQLVQRWTIFSIDNPYQNL